jgi:hypothetical protein
MGFSIFASFLVSCMDSEFIICTNLTYFRPLSRIQEIYRGCEGMMPYYNGHVPGEQFRIGKTYGTATRNAKRAIQRSLHVPLCTPIRRSGL